MFGKAPFVPLAVTGLCVWCSLVGKSNPYCELSMGAQCYTSRPQNDTINPKWNFSCQFFVKDLYQDVLCITVFERDQFSPDGKFWTQQEKKAPVITASVTSLTESLLL